MRILILQQCLVYARACDRYDMRYAHAALERAAKAKNQLLQLLSGAASPAASKNVHVGAVQVVLRILDSIRLSPLLCRIRWVVIDQQLPPFPEKTVTNRVLHPTEIRRGILFFISTHLP